MTRTRIENASLSVHIYHMNVFSPVHSRTRAIALYRPASHGCSFVNGARKEYVCFAAAFFSSALIISRFASSMLTAADAAIVIAIRHKSASRFMAHLRSLYHIFLYSSSAISSVFFTEYLFTDVRPSNGILPMLRISNRKNLQPER